MKKLFSIQANRIRVADEERMIFCVDGNYYDKNLRVVDEEDSFKADYDDEYNPWDEYWIENEGIDIKLISESVVEVEYETDDVFGKFGFKNQEGEFVIEPQYLFAHEFSYGLAAVNLNRTWFKTEDGKRYYENHYGYINERGETVIPFMYLDAYPFNKYGVAVVLVKDKSYLREVLIDIEGKIIPGTEDIDFSHYYDYEDRFFEFSYTSSYEYDEEELVGIYDTKERKVLIEPSVEDFIEWDEDFIAIYKRNEEHGISSYQYYINSKGEPSYKWLMKKRFAILEKPNKDLVTIVAIRKYNELIGNPSSYISYNGKKYDSTLIYGIYSSDEEFLVPLEYEAIREISTNIFACYKDGQITVYEYCKG